MHLIKNQFAAHFFKEISGLNYVYLNCPCERALEAQGDEQAELLLNKEDYGALLYVITSFPRIRSIRTRKEFRAQYIQITFSDQSRFALKLMVEVMRAGKKLMEAPEVLASGGLTPEGIRTPGEGFRFEYLMLNSLFARRDMPAAYCQWVKALSDKERTAVFGHVVSKYRFVIHLLDDLFIYDARYRFRVRRILRVQSYNKRFFRTINTARFLFFRIVNLLAGSWKRIDLETGTEENPQPLGSHVKAFLAKRAAG